DEVRGLLAGDVCVALADGNTPVLWGADVIVPQGLLGVWRVLRGVAEARANSRRATHLAMAGAVIGGLQLISGGTRGARRPPVPGWPRPDPVTVAGLTGIAMGWWSALRCGPRGRHHRRVERPADSGAGTRCRGLGGGRLAGGRAARGRGDRAERRRRWHATVPGAPGIGSSAPGRAPASSRARSRRPD